MKKRIAIKAGAFLLTLMCLAFAGRSALAEDSVTVRIPVSCTGAACTAVLYDNDGTELSKLELTPGVTSYFEVTCQGLDEFKYSIKLSDADGNGVTYDKTEFTVTVTTYYGSDGTVRYVITADPTGTLGEAGDGSGKPTEIVFENDPGGQPQTIEITVRKTWVGDGPHPASVRVQLRRGSVGVSTVTLTGPSWEHTFSNLPAGYSYSVVELAPPTGYEVTYLWSGNTCNVINTKLGGGPTPCFDDPPIRKIVEGQPSEDGSFTFVLTSDDPSYPMPEGSVNGKKEITIIGQGLEEVGLIIFTTPGTYTYTLGEKNTGAAGYTYDASEYKLSYEVTEENGRMVSKRTVTKDGVVVDGFTEAVFTNKYEGGDDPPGPNPPGPNPPGPNDPGRPGGPQTGDTSRLGLWTAGAGGSLLMIVLLCAYLTRQKRKEKRSEG